MAVRPLPAALVGPLAELPAQLIWSLLFRTAPVGGPADQSDYFNAVLLLDLDLLWFGTRACAHGELELPHPRLVQRAFVLAPLVVIEAARVPPLPDQPPLSCGGRLADLLTQGDEPPRPGWPE